VSRENVRYVASIDRKSYWFDPLPYCSSDDWRSKCIPLKCSYGESYLSRIV